MHKREMVISPGEEIELLINSVNHQGQGVGRFKGVAVFVPFTVPGDSVVAKITQVKTNFAIGEIVKITAPGKGRVEPRCLQFEACGGSQFQHMEYGEQLEVKRVLVEDSLKRIGRIHGAAVHPVIGMEEPWGYRNKAHFQVNKSEDGVRLGFYEVGSYNLVPATGCLLLDGQIRDIAGMVEKLLNKYRVSAYNWEKGQGLLRHVMIRKGWVSGKVMVVLVTSNEKFPEMFTVARELKAKVPQIASVIRNINTTSGREVLGRESRILAGQGSITDVLAGLVFTISPGSFFQVNPVQTEKLYGKTVEYASLTGKETVLDVYCGIGAISLLMAKAAGRVFGFEVSAEAVQDAAANARANNIGNVEFITGMAEDRLPKLVQQGVKPEVIVVDPPRQGVEKRALQAVSDMQPDRIVYISCDPSTMARDLNFLSHRGYVVKEVQPVDMFPQTAHTESVCLLEHV